MNPRIFKKLTKAASIQVERLGVVSTDLRFETTKCDDSYPEIGKSYKWERKSLEIFSGHPMLLRGTVGYGCSVGSDETEWDDNDALSCLFSYVLRLHTQWRDDVELRGNDCPSILKRSARHLINYTKML